MARLQLCPPRPPLPPRRGDPGGLCPAWPRSLGFPILISHEIQIWFYFWMVDPVVFIFSDKKLGIRQGGWKPTIPQPCSQPLASQRGCGGRFPWRPGPAAQRLTHSDLILDGRPSPRPNPGGSGTSHESNSEPCG